MLCSKTLMNSSAKPPVAWDITGLPGKLPLTPTGYTLSNTPGSLENFLFADNYSKLYIIAGSGNVDYYQLTTPGDVSTATYVSTKTNLSSSLKAIRFNNDGTKLYYFNTSANLVTATLSTPWNPNTIASTVSLSMLNILPVDSSAITSSTLTDFYFSVDGLKLFIHVRTNQYCTFVYTYNLSTAWDVSTQSAGYNADAIRPFSFYPSKKYWYFKPDGLKAIVSDGYTLYEHALSSSFNLGSINNTATSSISLGVTTIGLKLNPSGSNLFYSKNNIIESHILSTTWSLSSYGTTATSTLDIPTTYGSTATVVDFDFSSDGTQLYVQISEGKIIQYTMSFPWNLNTATKVNTLTVTGAYYAGLCISPDGKYLHYRDWTSKRFYVLSTPYNLSTAGTLKYANETNKQTYYLETSSIQYIDSNTMVWLSRYPATMEKFSVSVDASDNMTFNALANKTDATGIAMTNGNAYYKSFLSNDGAYLYFISPGYSLEKRPLSTTYQISNYSSASTNYIYIPSWGDTLSTIQFDSSGLYIYAGSSQGYMYKVYIGSNTPYSITSLMQKTFQEDILLDTSNYYASNGVSIKSINFSSNGNNLYHINNNNGTNTYRQTLSTAYYLNTLSSVATYSTNGYSGDNRIVLSHDGTKIFTLRSYSNYISVANLTTAYDITTKGNYTGYTLSYTYGNYVQGICFNSTGTILYVITDSNLCQYTLPSAYNITTISSLVPTYISTPSNGYNLKLSSDGTKIYTVRSGILYQYTMSTPYNISTAVQSGTYSIPTATGVNYIEGFDFSSDGKTIYFANPGGSIIYYKFVKD